MLVLAACDAGPAGLVDSTPTIPTDPTPSVPPAPTFGPAVVVDDLHVASFVEDANAFSLLGAVIDPLIAEQIAAGTLLLGLELRDVDDPTLQEDDALTVRMHALVDGDADPADNFDPDAPETFTVAADQTGLDFTDSTLAGGHLAARGLDALDGATLGVPLPVSDLSIEGDLVVIDGAVHTLDEGRLRGVIGASLLALTPNALSGTCPGASLLDVFATGCGLFGLQPDADVDGDGLEKLYDTDDDGAIDRCVDGDGTEILGTECPLDPAIADGYTLILVVHGVRAELAAAAP